MRKLVLLSIGLLYCGAIQAQIQKGAVQFGGSANWNTTDSGPLQVILLDIQPNAGYFISDRTSLGLLLGYNSTNRDTFINNNIAELTDNLFQYGVYARFHKSLNEKLYLYLQPSIRFGSGEIEFFPNQSTDIDQTDLGLTPGLTYFLSENWALEMRLGSIVYSSVNTSNTSSFERDQFAINLGLSNVGIGMNFYLK